MPNLPITLIIAIAGFSLALLLGFIQTLRKQPRSGCLSIALNGIALISFLIFSVQNAQNPDTSQNTFPFIAGFILALIVGGIIIWVLERVRTEDSEAMYSRGIFIIGMGIISGVLGLFVPQIPNQIFPIPTPTSIVQNLQINTSNMNSEVVSEINVTSIPSLTPSPTMTRTPLPEPTITRTLRAYVPPTITPTPVSIIVEDECGATVLTNLNVRAEDRIESDIVAIIPEGRYILLDAQNLTGDWWQTTFEDTTGWVSVEFLTLDSICLVAQE